MRGPWVLCLGIALVLASSGCGGGGSASPEDEVKDTVTEFLEAAIEGENGRACAMTTDVDECLSGLMLAEGFLGEGGLEAVLGDDWREQIENAEVTFTDDNHASLPPITPDEEGPTELVREDGEWRIVVEEQEP